MLKVKINKKHSIFVKDIEHIISKTNRSCWVYRKIGYPKILKADCSYNNFMLRIANVLN